MSELIPEFMNIPLLERENRIMPEVIRCLLSLGGEASKKEVVRDLILTSETIPEDYIEYARVSKQSGKSYKPFDFQFNFAVKNLEYAGYVTIPKRGMIKLTDKGVSTNLDIFDSEEMVRKLSEPIFEANKNKKVVPTEPSVSENKVDTEEESLLESSQVDSWRETLIDALKAMSPKKFELFCRRLVKEMGVEIDAKIGVQYVADGGLDGFGYITSDEFRTTRVAIQAKRWEGNVSSPEIDKFRGSMDKHNAEFGVFITTSSFTKNAIEASRVGTRVITLIDGDTICDLVAKYQLEVTPVMTYELGDFYLSEE
ncbi:restriction endonuclease [Vagococcus fluvialis]|uniref:restriction endonuclease n=1 Tax=Vagococcus fluvialis TaxID=2738 RepID=UPI003B599535